jgi:c-di-GMP-binding flagellar brake protein YcgR
MGIGLDDRRRFKRFSVDILGVSGKMLFASEVEILDISVGGVSLRVDKRLNIGGEYTLKVGKDGDTISVKGTVVWSKISGTKKGSRDDVIPFYTAGMRFSGMAAGQMKELALFIERATHHTREETHQLSGLRLSMRFPLRESNKAVLDVSGNYAVKKISLGGMLIQSEDPLEINEKLPMEILLPGGAQVRFVGRIASCFKSEDASPARYSMGIEFSEMPGPDKTSLKKFIDLLEDK